MRQNPPVVGDRGADAINRLTRTGPRVGFSRSHKSAGFTPRSRLTLAGVGRLPSVARLSTGKRDPFRTESVLSGLYARLASSHTLTAGIPCIPRFPTIRAPPITRSLTSIDSRE